jgi:hypothetical protein
MKVCIIDVYDDVDFRISKDQNGQYGTANDYGSGLLATVFKKFVKNNINIPPLYVAQVIGELRKNNHEVLYKNSYDGNDEFDFYVVVSSIVCHELEIQTIKNLKKKNLKVFSIGPFASNIPTPYIEAGSKVITGEPEMFFFDFALTQLKTRQSFGKTRIEEMRLKWVERVSVSSPLRQDSTNLILFGSPTGKPSIMTSH